MAFFPSLIFFYFFGCFVSLLRGEPNARKETRQNLHAGLLAKQVTRQKQLTVVVEWI